MRSLVQIVIVIITEEKSGAKSNAKTGKQGMVPQKGMVWRGSLHGQFEQGG